jgi:hypothetical protein
MESEIRRILAAVEAVLRDTAADRQRVAALLKGPEGPTLRAQLARQPGLAELLAAFNGMGKAPDPATATVFDRIRADAARRQGAQQIAPAPHDERMRIR